MKLLFFDDRPQGVYGAKQTMLAVAEEARRRGHEPLIASTGPGPFLDLAADRGFPTAEVVAHGAMLEFGRSFFKSGLWSRIRAGGDLLRLQIDLARLVRRENVDAVFINSVRAAVEVAGLLPLPVPAVWYVQIAEPFGIISKLGGCIPDRVVGLADELAVTAGGVPGTDFFDRIIPLGVELDRFLAVPDPEAGEGLRVVSMGSFVRRKGHELSVEVVDRLGSGCRSLTIAGTATDPEGDLYRDEVRARIAALGAPVELVGHVDDPAGFLAHADVLLHMASVEGTPRVIIEAMAAGRPVVCTSAGGTASLVEHGRTGYVVPVGDVAAATEALGGLVADPELRSKMGDAARRRAVSMFAESGMVGALVDELEGARRRRRAGIRVARSALRAR